WRHVARLSTVGEPAAAEKNDETALSGDTVGGHSYVTDEGRAGERESAGGRVAWRASGDRDGDSDHLSALQDSAGGRRVAAVTPELQRLLVHRRRIRFVQYRR